MTRTVLITGGRGQLAAAAGPAFAARGWDVVSTDIDTLDVRDRAAVLAAVEGLAPDAVLNLAAVTQADECEDDPDRTYVTNTIGVRHLAEACRRTGAHLCSMSSDYVFDGRRGTAYDEWDPVSPLNAYGRAKAASEREAGPSATIVRTAWLSGRHGRNIVKVVLDLARDPDRELAFVDDQRGSPTVAEDLAPVIARLVAERRPGRYHVTNQGEATWFDIARTTLVAAGYDPARIRPIATSELRPRGSATRPRHSVLDNAALRLAGVPPLPHWEDSVRALVADLQA